MEEKISKQTPAAPAGEPVSSNKRRFIRLPWASPTVLRYLNGDPATRTFILSSRLPGIVLNVSAGGALILCEGAPQPDELLTLELYLENQVSFGGILGKVKRVEPDEEGGFLVGVEFGSIQALAPERSEWLLPPGVVRFDRAFREALHHYLFTLEVARRTHKGEPADAANDA